MNKMKVKIFSIILLLCTTLFFACDCNKKKKTPEVTEQELVYVLNEREITIYVNETFSLEVLNVEADKTIAWEAENSRVASVDENGMVTGVKPGKADIRAMVDGKTFTCTVTVEVRYVAKPVLSLNLEKLDGEYRMTLQQGDSYTLRPTLKVGGETKNVEFSYSADNATVSIDNGKVTPTAVGETVITVSCTYDNVSYSVNCRLTTEEAQA